MKSLLKYITAIVLLGSVMTATAQPLKNAYFLERVALRHQLNPALVPERGYFAVPGLGNFSMSVSSDLNYTTFIYPSDGKKLNTFLSPAISAADFDKKLKDRNVLNADLGVSILSFGFHKWNGFNTFDISLNTSASVALPGDLFRFLKNGNEEGSATQYDLKDISAHADAYIEVALGHAHHINDQWTVGAKLKALLGGAQANAHFERLTLTMSEEQWKIESYGVADMSCAGAQLETDAETGEISGFDFNTNNLGLAGGGAGIDLGVTYTPVENLIVSMAVTDIGFINWNKNLRGVTPEGEVIYDGFTGIGSDDYVGEDGKSQNVFDDQVDQLTDDLKALVEFHEDVAPSKRTTWLNPALTVGAEYQLLHNHISVGLLSSTRFYKNNTHTSLMGSINFKPFRWFMLAINGTISNLDNSFGAVLNLGPLFIGADISTMRVTPEYIPLGDLAANLNFGISIPLGKDPRLKKETVDNSVPENM